MPNNEMLQSRKRTTIFDLDRRIGYITWRLDDLIGIGAKLGSKSVVQESIVTSEGSPKRLRAIHSKSPWIALEDDSGGSARVGIAERTVYMTNQYFDSAGYKITVQRVGSRALKEMLYHPQLPEPASPRASVVEIPSIDYSFSTPSSVFNLLSYIKREKEIWQLRTSLDASEAVTDELVAAAQNSILNPFLAAYCPDTPLIS